MVKGKEVTQVVGKDTPLLSGSTAFVVSLPLVLGGSFRHLSSPGTEGTLCPSQQ